MIAERAAAFNLQDERLEFRCPAHSTVIAPIGLYPSVFNRLGNFRVFSARQRSLTGCPLGPALYLQTPTPQTEPVERAAKRRALYFTCNGHSIEIKGPDIQMKLSLFAWLLVAASFTAYAQSAMPRMTSVDPDSGKRGEVITVTGENLGKNLVAKVYLTDGGDGKNDVEVQVTEQTDTTIKFKIPAKGIGGRLALLILTATKPPQMIEQPVKVTIDGGAGQR
jgi:hypothetical protein